jgi:hypothetical protein
MKSAIEAARRREQRTSELAIAARHARERHDLYKAKTYGPTMTSFARLRELEQARDLAEGRLRRAQETMPDDRADAEDGAAGSAADPPLELGEEPSP